jgi:hypothetical protein
MEFPLLHEPVPVENVNDWICKIPVIGWAVGYSRQCDNELMLVQQAVDRGAVPESEWSEYEYDVVIRRTIEQIVIRGAYPRGSTFHPLDPIELMMVLRYGDLNECEIILEIEDAFGITIDQQICSWLIDCKVTFIDFIRFIQSNRNRVAD